jgi:hypothetical protein
MNKLLSCLRIWVEENMIIIPSFFMILILFFGDSIIKLLLKNTNPIMHDMILIIAYFLSLEMMGLIMITTKRVGGFDGIMVVIFGYLLSIGSLIVIIYGLYIHRLALFGISW